MGNENLEMNMASHPLVRRMFILIEDDECDKAREIIDKILNEYPECAEAYLGELMLELGIHTKGELASVSVDFSENKKYKRALMYAEGELKEFLESVSIVSLINEFINVTREEGLNPIDVLLNDGASDNEDNTPPPAENKKDKPSNKLDNLGGTMREGDFEFVYKNGHYALSWYRGKGGIVTVPSSFRGEPVTEIARDAFKDNALLKKVIIPEGITEIGIFAFFGCSALSEVTLPSTLHNLCTYAFGKCINLKEINLPKKLEYIGIMAFYYCFSLKKLVIPPSVKKIGRDAFRQCYGLVELTVPFLGEGVNAENNTFTHFFDGIDNALFPGSTVPKALKTVNVTGGVRVSADAFRGCRYIKSITLPASTALIERYAFANCADLTELSLGGFDGWYCTENIGEAEQRLKAPSNAVGIVSTKQCAMIFKGDGSPYYWYKA